jgi:hypothetical protein
MSKLYSMKYVVMQNYLNQVDTWLNGPFYNLLATEVLLHMLLDSILVRINDLVIIAKTYSLYDRI